MTRALALTLLVLATGAGAGAQTLPTLTKPVNDFAHVIDAASAAEMDRRIRALETSTPLHDAVVVATVESIAPYGSIEEYALKLFERAGIGQKGQNNGLLIILSKSDRAVRIEVGYDLEEWVTDGFSGDVIRQQMLPAFRRGEFGPGLLAGTTRVINRIAEGRGVTLTDVPKEARRDRDVNLSWLPIAIVFAFILIGMIRRGGGPRSGYRGRRPPWGGWGGPFIGGMGGGGFGGGFGGGGGGGGGFGGFGGGISGGGGASGRW